VFPAPTDAMLMLPLVDISVIGGLILLSSAILLIIVLVRSHVGERTIIVPLNYAPACEVHHETIQSREACGDPRHLARSRILESLSAEW
jgi:hypothetical protein